MPAHPGSQGQSTISPTGNGSSSSPSITRNKSRHCASVISEAIRGPGFGIGGLVSHGEIHVYFASIRHTASLRIPKRPPTAFGGVRLGAALPRAFYQLWHERPTHRSPATAYRPPATHLLSRPP